MTEEVNLNMARQLIHKQYRINVWNQKILVLPDFPCYHDIISYSYCTLGNTSTAIFYQNSRSNKDVISVQVNSYNTFVLSGTRDSYL